MLEYYSLNKYLIDTFGEKVYKIAIDGGFTCPNRDGKIDTRGCVFCSGAGSGDFAGNRNCSVTEQIEQGKALVADKYKGNKYIAYFQAFTNTYASVETLRRLFTEAINHPDIVAISIGTRPDCLPDEVLDLLSELNQIKPVWVELGLQTIHQDTAQYIRRGYDLPVYDRAISCLNHRKINTIVHIILGLPGENKQKMLETVDYVVKSGARGIKLQLLHVIKGTDMARDYKEGKFEVMSMEEYIDVLIEALKIIPKDVVIHRLTGDGDKRTLIAPQWSANKKLVLNSINQRIAKG